MTEYVAKVQIKAEAHVAASTAYFKREVPDHEVATGPTGDTWFTLPILGETDELAGERLYNLLTRLEMDLSMRAGTASTNDPLEDGIVLMMAPEGRLVLASGVDL